MSIQYQLLIGPGPSTSLMVPMTDMSPFVKSVDTTRGRSTELDDIQAGTAKVMLDNASGILTPGRSLSDEMMPANVNTGGDALGNTSGWAAYAGSTITGVNTSDPHSGTNCVEVHVTTASGQFVPVVFSATSPSWAPNPYTVTVQPLATYQGSMWVRNADSGTHAAIAITAVVLWADSSGTVIGFTNLTGPTTLTVGGGWHHYVGSAQAPAGAYYAWLVAYNYTGGVDTLIYVDDWSLLRTYPYVNQVVPDTPVRLAAIEGGNYMPYQLANVDHYADQGNGDAEAFGRWTTTGPAVSAGTQKGAINFYDTPNGGLQLQHVSGAVNGNRAFIVNASASRIANLPPGTYTLACRAKGLVYGTGATVSGSVSQLNYASARATPTVVSTATATPLALTGANQTLSFPFTITAQSAGLTSVQVEVWTDMVGGVQATVDFSQFQIVAGTVLPAFAAGDGCYPLFAGWADSWTTTTQGAAGSALVELDCTDQFRALGNAQVSMPYQSMVINAAATMFYYPFNDTAASVIASGVADSGPTQTGLSLFVANSNDTKSYGMQAGMADLLAVTTGTGGVTNTTTRPNYAGLHPTFTSTSQSGFSFEWSQNNTGNCGAAAGKAQFPQTSALNTALPALGTSGGGSFDCWMELDSDTTVLREVALIGPMPGTGSNAGWRVRMTMNPAISSTTMTLEVGYNANHDTTVTSLFDGLVHHFALLWNVTGSTITWSVLIDGVQVASASDSYTAVANQSVLIGAEVTGTTVSNCWVGRIAHVAISSNGALDTSARIAMGEATYTSTEAGRIAVLMAAAGADVFTDCLEPGLEATGWISWTAGTIVSDAAKTAANECGGTFLMGRTGNPLYQERNRIPARVTFQDSTGTSVDDGVQFYVDRDHVINQVVITMANGTVIRAQNFTSIALRGVYSDSFSISYNDSTAAQTIANNLVALHGMPLVRITGASFTCVNGLLASQALGLDVGARITLSGLPSTAPQGSMNFIVQQVSVAGGFEEGGATAPVVSVELSPDLS